jgi:hypothetical protein
VAGIADEVVAIGAYLGDQNAPSFTDLEPFRQRQAGVCHTA